MKTLLTLFFLFFSSSVIAQVYYCVEEDAVGFDSGKNLKQTDFDEIKFTADIDFEKLYLKSEDIFIDTSYDSSICINDFQNKYMQCVNGFGSSFTINKISLKFVYTVGLGYIIDRKSSDDLILSYGECSLF